jgi:hypothetical protein
LSHKINTFYAPVNELLMSHLKNVFLRHLVLARCSESVRPGYFVMFRIFRWGGGRAKKYRVNI